MNQKKSDDKNNVVDKRVKRLKQLKQPEQKTPEWYEARSSRITASEVSSCLRKCPEHCKWYVESFNLADFVYDNKSCNSYCGYDDYIVRKCEEFFGEYEYKDNEFTIWGKKYEQIMCDLYSWLTGKYIEEFGLIKHPKLSWLGASPDGITNDGVMLEIKCPKSRKINGIPPIYYYHQMLLQLECCNLDYCDYLEGNISECTYKEWINTDVDNVKRFKGIILQYEEDNKLKYIYPDKNLKDPIDFLKWISHFDDTFTPLYFIIHEYCLTTINRSIDWFNSVKPELKKTSDFIKSLQKDYNKFCQYRQTIWESKNSKFIEKFNSTECLLDHEDVFMQVDVSHSDVALICSPGPADDCLI